MKKAGEFWTGLTRFTGLGKRQADQFMFLMIVFPWTVDGKTEASLRLHVILHLPKAISSVVHRHESGCRIDFQICRPSIIKIITVNALFAIDNVPHKLPGIEIPVF